MCFEIDWQILFSKGTVYIRFFWQSNYEDFCFMWLFCQVPKSTVTITMPMKFCDLLDFFWWFGPSPMAVTDSYKACIHHEKSCPVCLFCCKHVTRVMSLKWAVSTHYSHHMGKRRALVGNDSFNSGIWLRLSPMAYFRWLRLDSWLSFWENTDTIKLSQFHCYFQWYFTFS